MPITKRPCANCPFRCDGAGIPLQPGRIEGIVSGLLANPLGTFVCHKTLDKELMTCAGAVAVMSKLGCLPVIADLGITYGVITKQDIQASEELVIDPRNLVLSKDSAEISDFLHFCDPKP